MSDEPNDVFDVDRVRSLVELMIEHGLSEVDLRQHGQTIRLRRGGEAPLVAAPMPAVAAAPAAASPPVAAESDDEADLIVAGDRWCEVDAGYPADRRSGCP